MACLSAFRSTPRAFRVQGWQSLRASSTATRAAPSAKTATPEHSAAKPHVHTAHHAIGTTNVSSFHLKPEIRIAQVLKKSREVMPKFMGSVHGVWGLPGPRALLVGDEETHKFTAIHFWESQEAMQKFEKSEEMEKIMHDFGAFFDIKSMTHASHSSDFHYWTPVKPCNYERYPVAVGTFKVKPGFRQLCHKLVTSNADVARLIHDSGILFQVLTYNEAEDECVSYNVYKDLLKYTEFNSQLGKKFADWGLAEYVVGMADAHDAHKDAAHHEDPHKVHSNSWVYSE